MSSSFLHGKYSKTTYLLSCLGVFDNLVFGRVNNGVLLWEEAVCHFWLNEPICRIMQSTITSVRVNSFDTFQIFWFTIIINKILTISDFGEFPSILQNALADISQIVFVRTVQSYTLFWKPMCNRFVFTVLSHALMNVCQLIFLVQPRLARFSSAETTIYCYLGTLSWYMWWNYCDRLLRQ